MTECPFESGAVKCARCGGPYNVDNNTQSLPIETAKLMLSLAVIPPKVLYYLLGGICDICNYTVGAVIKPNK